MSDDREWRFPLQPVCIAEDGMLRFRSNALVRWLLDNGGKTMNDLAIQEFPAEDRQQFAQLIGYSLRGYSELSYVDDAAYERAELVASRVPLSEGSKEQP